MPGGSDEASGCGLRARAGQQGGVSRATVPRRPAIMRRPLAARPPWSAPSADARCRGFVAPASAAALSRPFRCPSGTPSFSRSLSVSSGSNRHLFRCRGKRPRIGQVRGRAANHRRPCSRLNRAPALMIRRMKQRVQVVAGACLLWVVSAKSALREFEYHHNLRQYPEMKFDCLLQAFPKVRVG